jgi:hypothetical protein
VVVAVDASMVVAVVLVDIVLVLLEKVLVVVDQQSLYLQQSLQITQ